MTVVDTGGGERQPGQAQERPGQSYAGLVAGRQASGRKKLNVLDIILERKDNKISYNLKKDELAKLLFKKMKLDPKNVLKVDTSGFGKILVEFNNNVNVESLVSLPAFDIRDGLRVKYYKPHHRKETLVSISWLDLETPDELLVHLLNHFGQVKSNVRWSKIRQEDGEGELEKLLNNILSGERQLWMEISHPLPSYAVVDKRRVKIYHAGQRRTCARCQKIADACKGNSNARLCEDNGGVKINVADAWKEILTSVKYIEWKGEGVETLVIEENENGDKEANEDDKAVDITNCDGFVISNLEEEASIDDIKALMKGLAPDDAISSITVHPTGSTRSKIIKDIDPAIVNMITRKIDNKSFKGRLLHCRPHVPVSPPAKKKDEASAAHGDDNAANVESIPNEGTPKEPVKTVTSPNPSSSSIVNKETSKGVDVDIPKSKIPGLSPQEIENAKKKAKANRLKKKEEKKAENKANEGKAKKTEVKKKLKDMNQSDFLMNSTTNTTKVEEFDDFVFEHTSDSEEEVFEDSVEAIQDDDIQKFLTPKPFKSSYAKKVEASMVTPKAPSDRLKRSISLAELSPIETAEPKKVKPIKTATKSALPRSISLAELGPIETAEPKKVKPIKTATKSALPRLM